MTQQPYATAQTAGYVEPENYALYNSTRQHKLRASQAPRRYNYPFEEDVDSMWTPQKALA